jgi:peptide/nickel transport system substrate-binding protein
MERLMDPELHSPTGDSFRTGNGKVACTVLGADKVAIHFPSPVAGLDRLFDQVAILSSQSPKKEMAVLGPYRVQRR